MAITTPSRPDKLPRRTSPRRESAPRSLLAPPLAPMSDDSGLSAEAIRDIATAVATAMTSARSSRTPDYSKYQIFTATGDPRITERAFGRPIIKAFIIEIFFVLSELSIFLAMLREAHDFVPSLTLKPFPGWVPPPASDYTGVSVPGDIRSRLYRTIRAHLADGPILAVLQQVFEDTSDPPLPMAYFF